MYTGSCWSKSGISQAAAQGSGSSGMLVGLEALWKAQAGGSRGGTEGAEAQGGCRDTHAEELCCGRGL